MTPQSDAISFIPSFFILAPEEETQIKDMAAIGLKPTEIAVTMGWPAEKRKQFIGIASQPDSNVAVLIASGRVTGRANPLIKLQKAASEGELDAIKEYQQLQARNLFTDRINSMDDDEFTPQAITDKL